MNLLVAGGNRVDAGKTTFTTGLLDRLDAVGFKPRAGNDYWFDHDDYRRAVDDGRLYGKDAARLAAASPAAVEPEEINPVHRLWRPSPGPDTGVLGQSRREFVVDRVGETFVRNATVDAPESARENLPIGDAIAVDSLEAVNAAMETHHLPAFREVAEAIANADPVVAESYGDVALPIRGVEFDAVAVVEPERVRTYDGRRYGKAREVAAGSAREGQLEERVPDVVDLLDPATEQSLPALSSDERNDPSRVAAAYEPAYDALLAVARD